MAQRSTVADWAPYIGTSIFVRLFSLIRSVWMMTVWDGPVAWWLGFYGKNMYEDLEGPFFLVGSPSRATEDGKGILASVDILKKSKPFLFVLDVKDTKGDPVPNAVLDCWQADSDGTYYFASWTLRGRVTADVNGHLEILTVRPGDYGGRAGHLHAKTTGIKGKHVPMTTQVYVCAGNRPSLMESDVAKLWRSSRVTTMATCWSMDGKFDEFPKVPAERVDLTDRINWWNGKLKEHGIEKEILGVAQHEYKLTAY